MGFFGLGGGVGFFWFVLGVILYQQFPAILELHRVVGLNLINCSSVTSVSVYLRRLKQSWSI